VERNLYWVTHGVYQSAVTNRVTHLVYSHHHAAHGGTAYLFDVDVVRIGQKETRRLLLRDNDPAGPLPEVTFADRYTLELGGERVELAGAGAATRRTRAAGARCRTASAGRLPGRSQIAQPRARRTTVTSPTTGASSATDLPDYAPVPRLALGPALNDQGYYVGRVERNLYWVTDGTYQSAFLTTRDGVVLLDAPPTIGNNLRRAVDEIAAANGVSNKVTHLIYSHHHADHAGASSLFDGDVVRIGHEETRRLLLRDNDPARPAPEETFSDRRTLEIGGERIELVWHGPNHSPDNIFIHLPDHDTLMLVDIVNPGWAPVYIANLTEDVAGYNEAAATALTYPWKHYIGGHLGRLGTRDDVTLHQRYMADIAASVKTALDTLDPTPYFQKYGENVWAGVKGYLDAVTDAAAAPVIEKYTGVLAAADVFTASTTFWVMESIRLDFGYASYVHP
jgi:glyoxylase-like metal-dependent hydrolase (beta-lactamase superfamily II)